MLKVISERLARKGRNYSFNYFKVTGIDNSSNFVDGYSTAHGLRRLEGNPFCRTKFSDQQKPPAKRLEAGGEPMLIIV
ncbi:MAG: hypothetical protein EOP53_09865 [Sphingobacteriales bacterium]|nr:MAG: hypothetical protein EOP53_09865 [Sphingobacteriales bacterium]